MEKERKKSDFVGVGHILMLKVIYKKAANDRMGDWLFSRHLMVQEESVTPIPVHYTA